MIKCSVGIGKRDEEFYIPSKNYLADISMRPLKAAHDPLVEIEQALNEPIGTEKLETIAKGKKNAVIITSDITRPMPSHIVLPLVLERLYQAGLTDGQISIMIAVGSHRRHSAEEKKALVGEAVYDRILVRDSGEDGYVYLGETGRGTPIEADIHVVEADLRICLGNVEFHYFAGYSGGAKAIMPGVCSRASIQANHKFMTRPDSVAGKLEGNPLREDIEEAVKRYCPGHFLLNVVLDEKKNIVKAFSGDIVQAHREACKLLKDLYMVAIPQAADIVIASQGGSPKDLNLYQLQKGLENAKYAVKEGGIIILVGSCREGLGEKHFEEWMLSAKEPDDLIERIEQDFVLGGHKAAAICIVMKKAKVFLVSDMSDELVRQIMMTPFNTVKEALAKAMEEQGPDCKIAVMGHAGSTMPYVQ